MGEAPHPKWASCAWALETPPLNGDIAAARRALGITQAELADRWGRSQSQVARIENAPVGSIMLRTLTSYADALGGSCRVTIEVGDRQFQLAGVSGLAS